METLYYNGQILTLSTPTPPSHNPEAVLIKAGLITKVGTLEELEASASPNVKKVDLAGRCLMPAFIDPHSHFVMNAKMALYADLSDCSSFSDIIRVLKEYIRKKEAMLADYEDELAWSRKTLVNIAKAGFFSSDRTIAEYNRDIWHL